MPQKKPPVLALLAVLVPVLVIAAVAAFGGGSGDGSTATPTTSGISTAEAAANEAVAGPGAGTAPARATTTTVAAGSEPGSSTTRPADAAPPTAAPAADVASTPGNAGPEGDRTTVTYPQPEVPAAGCRGGSGTAVLELRATPSSGCLRVAADQALVIRNRTGREISVVSVSLNEVVAAGSEVRLGRAGDTFGTGRSTVWSPGNPELSTIIEVT